MHFIFDKDIEETIKIDSIKKRINHVSNVLTHQIVWNVPKIRQIPLAEHGTWQLKQGYSFLSIVCRCLVIFSDLQKSIEIARFKPAMNKDGSSVTKSTEKPFDLHMNQPSDQPKQIFYLFFFKSILLL